MPKHEPGVGMGDDAAERTAGPIRVVVVDDHEMVLEGIRRLLEGEPDIEVVGTASTVAGAVAVAEAGHPAVALVDYQLPDGRGTDAATSIRAVSATTRTLIITGSTEESVLVAAIEAGCSGVLTKNKAFAELVGAIHVVAAGETYVDPHVLAAVRPSPAPRSPGLETIVSKREREVLVLMAQGRTNQAIGTDLFVSLNTVRNHVQSILRKLEVHSKLEAVFVARREGLLEP